MSWRRGWSALAGLFSMALAGCGDDPSAGSGATGTTTTPPEPPPASEDRTRDFVHMDLAVDIAALSGTATIELAPSEGTGATFEGAGLTVTGVRDDDGPLNHEMVDGLLHVGVPATGQPARVTIDYTFVGHSSFDGLLPGGSTLVWPYWCGNLFPCKSDPADGLTFALSVTGQPAGSTSVFPERVDAESPSYMVAWATGEYGSLDLGTTAAGTRIMAYYRAGGEADAAAGTAHLRGVFDWYEQTYGAYTFGATAGSVSVKWGAGAYGGMEHHPLWHIADIAMDDPWIHAHEAAHGWFGDGIRIACWEDFVLSEGTVSYLEARAVAETQGAAEGDAVWAHYQSRLDAVMAKPSPKIAWPDSCGVVDIYEDELFSDIVYMKGAFFFRALEARVGVAGLDAALRSFYGKNAGKAAGMQDLLDEVEAVTGYDPAACAAAWLRSEAVPVDPACP
ncbi:MAG: peptidase M1 [Polyangiaceae bacterium]|nr:peptidase M1 [Polyangiaceae bacterium]